MLGETRAIQNGALYVLAMVLLSVALLAGCTDKSKPKAKVEKSALQKEIDEYEEQQRQEQIFMIATKHGVGYKIAQGVIHDYMMQHDLDYKDDDADKKGKKLSDDDLRANMNFGKTIRTIHDTYGVRTDIIAAMVLEYRQWKTVSDVSKRVDNIIIYQDTR
jgi:major membrane immunogen (membrane-anchored lipoprotein)